MINKEIKRYASGELKIYQREIPAIYTRSLKTLEGIPLVEKPVFEKEEKPPVPPGSSEIHKVKMRRHKFKMLCSTGEIELPDFQKMIEA